MTHSRNTASALLAAALVAICCLTLTQQVLADGLRLTIVWTRDRIVVVIAERMLAMA